MRTHVDKRRKEELLGRRFLEKRSQRCLTSTFIMVREKPIAYGTSVVYNASADPTMHHRRSYTLFSRLIEQTQ